MKKNHQIKDLNEVTKYVFVASSTPKLQEHNVQTICRNFQLAELFTDIVEISESYELHLSLCKEFPFDEGQGLGI